MAIGLMGLPAAPVTFSVSGYPGRRFEGRITRVNPTADPATGQVRITVSVSNAGSNLVAGLFAVAVSAFFDAVQRGIDLGDQLALAVACPELDCPIGLG